MNQEEGKIYKIEGAADELIKLVDWIDVNKVDEFSLRQYLQSRIKYNSEQIDVESNRLQAEKAVLKSKLEA